MGLDGIELRLRAHHGAFPIIGICYMSTLSTVIYGHANGNATTIGDNEGRVVPLKEVGGITFGLELGKRVGSTSSYAVLSSSSLLPIMTITHHFCHLI